MVATRRTKNGGRVIQLGFRPLNFLANEVTVGTTCSNIVRLRSPNVELDRPAHCRLLHLLDEFLQTSAPGLRVELVIGVPGCARLLESRPDL